MVVNRKMPSATSKTSPGKLPGKAPKTVPPPPVKTDEKPANPPPATPGTALLNPPPQKPKTGAELLSDMNLAIMRLSYTIQSLALEQQKVTGFLERQLMSQENSHKLIADNLHELNVPVRHQMHLAEMRGYRAGLREAFTIFVTLCENKAAQFFGVTRDDLAKKELMPVWWTAFLINVISVTDPDKEIMKIVQEIEGGTYGRKGVNSHRV